MKHPRTYCWNQCAFWQKQFTCQSYFAAMQDWSHHYEITSCTLYWSHWNCTCCITHEAHLLDIRLPMPRIWWSRVFLGPKEQAQENEFFVYERQCVKAEPWIPAPNFGGSRINFPATETHRNQRSVCFTKQMTYAVSEVFHSMLDGYVLPSDFYGFSSHVNPWHKATKYGSHIWKMQ